MSRVPNKEVGLDFLARLDEFTVHLIYLLRFIFGH